MYFYSANAHGVAGEISRPRHEIIPDAPAVTLAVIGGTVSAEAENFRNGVLSFRHAEVRVEGSFDPKGRAHTTVASALVQGLRVLNMVSADEIVAQLTATQSSGDAEPRILATGSYFEGLRIAGQRVHAGLALDVFSQYDTFESFDYAYKNSPKNVHPLLHGSRLPPHPEGDHPSLERMWSWVFEQGEKRSFYWASLVNKVDLEPVAGLQNYGSIIVVPSFGIIHLGELLVQKGQRRLNMLRLQLGSPTAGNIVAASVSCNGLPGDPTVDD